jgi:hypothetical protein
VFVDNLLIIGPFKPKIDTIKAQLAQRFYMTDLGLCKHYLGIEIMRDRKSQVLKLSQQGYIKKVLRDFDIWNCNTKHNTLIATHTKLQKAEQDYKATKENVK